MKTIIIPTTTLAALTLGLAGCASADSDADSPAGTSNSASPTAEEHSATAPTEVEEAVSRLTVAHEGGVTVLELTEGTLEPIAELSVDGTFRANAGADGRYVYLADSEAGTVSILDAGAYGEPHGEHYHYYVAEPTFLDEQLSGANPVHVVGHDGQVAVFYDDSGAIDILDEASLATGTASVSQQATEHPHHGVAVALEGGAIWTEAAEGESLPASVRQADAAGETVVLHEDICPGLHGETSIGDVVYFGCNESVAVIDTADHTSTSIPYPADAGEGRIGSFYGTESVLAAPWDDDTIVLLDTTTEGFTFVDVDGTISTVSRGAHDEVLVLTTDGTLTVIDEDGDTLAQVVSIGEFELPEGHGGVRPSIAIVGTTVVISDPNASTLELIDGESWESAGTVTLDAAPTMLVATGGVADAGHDDHDHETEDHADDAHSDDDHADEDHGHEDHADEEHDGHDH
ncbi:hypothetical protein [Demequina sediminicola]|uniref:hypothetical protein n=1 Tax=Demequina sediminicola TaxID=1095026 RepID=UPI000A7DDBBB|nr:hypothetical protein [Demequina sediminicola]